MPRDSINDEILKIKRSLSAAFDNDLDRIVADIRSRQKNVVRLPPRPYMLAESDAPKPPIGPILDEASSPLAKE